MIVKLIGRDPRIRDLSELAQRLWPYILPHTETGGALPRDAHELRLTCFPDWNLNDGQVETAILEWLITRPPIATEQIKQNGQKRLILNDFYIANGKLYRDKERQRSGTSASRASRASRSRKEVNGVAKPPIPKI